jgi:hypothetical protein
VIAGLAVGVLGYMGYSRWYVVWWERRHILQIPVVPDPGRVEGTRIYRVVDGRLVRFFDKGEPRPVMFSPDGRFVVTEQPNGRMGVWEWSVTPRGVGLGRRIVEVRGDPLGFSRDGRRFAGLQGARVAVWDTEGGHLVMTFSVPGTVMAAGFSGEGDALAAVLDDGRILCWTVRDGRLLGRHRLEEGEGLAGYGGVALWPLPEGWRIFVHRMGPAEGKYRVEQYTLTKTLVRDWSREMTLFGDLEIGQVEPVEEGVWVKAIDEGKTVLLLLSPEGGVARRVRVGEEPMWIGFAVSGTLVAAYYRFRPCPEGSEGDEKRPLCVRLLKLPSGEELAWIHTAPLPVEAPEGGYSDVGRFMFTPDGRFLVLETYRNLSGD